MPIRILCCQIGHHINLFCLHHSQNVENSMRLNPLRMCFPVRSYLTLIDVIRRIPTHQMMHLQSCFESCHSAVLFVMIMSVPTAHCSFPLTLLTHSTFPFPPLTDLTIRCVLFVWSLLVRAILFSTLIDHFLFTESYTFPIVLYHRHNG